MLLKELLSVLHPAGIMPPTHSSATVLSKSLIPGDILYPQDQEVILPLYPEVIDVQAYSRSDGTLYI